MMSNGFQATAAFFAVELYSGAACRIMMELCPLPSSSRNLLFRRLSGCFQLMAIAKCDAGSKDGLKLNDAVIPTRQRGLSTSFKNKKIK